MQLFNKLKEYLAFEFPDLKVTPSDDFEEINLSNESSEQLKISQSQSAMEFDNKMRIAVSLTAFVASAVLAWGGLVASFSPIVAVFGIYAAIQLGIAWKLKKGKLLRSLNYAMCGMDLMALSLAIYWTGGVESPLYFIYFIPLIIQSFHRDWKLLAFYGFFGLVAYSIILAFSIQNWTSEMLVDLASRLFFMVFTILVALLAIGLLQRRENTERVRHFRTRVLLHINQLLNKVIRTKDLPEVIDQILDIVNKVESRQTHSWARVLLSSNGSPLMKAIEQPANPNFQLKSEIPVQSCPALQKNTVFTLHDNEKESGCPTENFPYRSHFCYPINGIGKESYGVLFCGSTKPNAIGDQIEKYFQFIARSIGLTVDRLRKVEELSLAFEMDSCAMATFLSSTKTIEATLDSILESMRGLVKADQTSIYLWNPQKGLLELKGVLGEGSGNLINQTFHMGEGIPGKVLEKSTPYWTYELDQHNEFRESHPHFRGLLALPLYSVKTEPIGVIHIFIKDSTRLFSVEEIETASTFAIRAAVSLENAFLHHLERQANNISVNIENKSRAA